MDVAVATPNTGVTSVGLVAKTFMPVPVLSVRAASRFALLGVPRNVATPVPSEVIPVPPFATGRVPVTPVDRGNPVAFVNVTLVGVPSASVPLKTALLKVCNVVQVFVLEVIEVRELADKENSSADVPDL